MYIRTEFMRIGKYTYRFSLLLAVSMSMVLLMKINKISFYHHYFKVIEEVEIRNSQELAIPLSTIRVATNNVSAFWQYVLNSLGLGLFIVVFFIPFLSFLYRLEWLDIRLSSAKYLISFPIRAP